MTFYIRKETIFPTWWVNPRSMVVFVPVIWALQVIGVILITWIQAVFPEKITIFKIQVKLSNVVCVNQHRRFMLKYNFFWRVFCVLSKVCLWKAINMLRFFSRRKPKGRKDQRYGSGGGYSNVGNGTSRKPLGPTSKHKMLDCKVIFLDGEDETFPITVSSHWLLKSSSFILK